MAKTHLDFTTIREDFNEYHVENGQILKVKTLLTNISVEIREDGTKSSHLGLKDFSTVVTNIPIDTSNLESASAELVTEKDHIKELKFERVKEIVNIYETKGFLILLALRVINVFLTNKKDNTDSPILRYTHNTTISLIGKDTLYKVQL